MALGAFILSSCVGAPAHRTSGDYHLIEEVPFYQMDSYQCGPASLAAVMNYWKADVLPGDIAAEIYSQSAQGTLGIDMAMYAKSKGFHAKQYKGNIEDIRYNIRSGYPVIVLIDYGFWVYQKNHFMVIVGYNDQGIFTNSVKGTILVTWKRFVKLWSKTGSWTLLISPKHS
ncbi:MAG: C39 family peptidase [Desulfatiglans sp.]|nr:C39 family peptidase [Desulfatiglans sp.]